MRTRIRYYRLELGIKQGDLAKMLNVSRQTISALENGRYNPSLELAYKITKVLGCKYIEDIFILDEDENIIKRD
ncbi:MAG: helix-turn-helix transcriptional regulator [Methanobrevibacter sp.]|jgi:putative transcriptional regulator|nr:helix-turn-helix transcriptional regulator [Methanobrevibacter sp.]